MTASSAASTTAANIGFRAASSIGRMPARAAVLNAAKISPLPWRATDPARARPRPTRRARRSSWAGEHGASVATMPMQLPASPPSGDGSGGGRSVRPTGTPSTVSRSAEPKLVRRRTPTVNRPSTTREAVPMPPFHSQQIMPVPAPTAPSATGPAVAPSTAARTSSAEIWVRRASLSQESSHSPTMGMVTRSRPTAGSSSASSSTTASHARPTCIVDVSRIGVSSTPHSRTWMAEVSSPAPLSTATPAARPWRTTSLTGPGTMAVTPVRATPRPAGGSGSSRQTVVWPTRTPGTSVMALPGPVGSRPISMPSSRARVRGVGAGIRRTVPSRPPGGVWRGSVSPCDEPRQTGSARPPWRRAVSDEPPMGVWRGCVRRCDGAAPDG